MWKTEKQVSISDDLISEAIKKDKELINKFNTYRDLENYADMQLSWPANTLISRIQWISKWQDVENLLSNIWPNTLKRILEDNPSLWWKIWAKITIYRTWDWSIKPWDMVAIEKSLSQWLQEDRWYWKMTKTEVSPNEIVIASDSQEFYYVPKELQKDTWNFTQILNNLKKYYEQANKPKLIKKPN